MISLWVEWLVCLVAVATGWSALRWGRKWAFAGSAIVLVTIVAGTAGFLLVPALLASWCGLLRRFPKIASIGTGCLGAVSALGCWLFPLPEAPSIRHPVGTIAMEIPAEGDTPRLAVQIWYPAQVGSEGKRAAWLPDPGVAPRFPLNRIAGARARSIVGAPIQDGAEPFRVLFYEHAWMGHRAENVAQVEHLASEGFVVIAVDHPGQAARIRYENGEVVTGSLPKTPNLTTESEVAAFEKSAMPLFQQREREIKRVRDLLIAGEIAVLKGHILTDVGGVFGFSFGGATAIHLCGRDPWFRAGANEDGFFLGMDEPAGAFLFIDEEEPAWLTSPPSDHESPEQRLIRRSEEKIVAALSKPGRVRLILDGTRHESFSDRLYLSAMPIIAKAGRRPAQDVHDTVSSAVAVFFRTELSRTKESSR